MVVATAATALQSIQTVYQLVAATQSLKTDTEVRLAIGNMLDEVNAAKRAISDAIDTETALKSRVRELEEENHQLKKRDSELERYECKRFFPGSTAYVEKGTLGAQGAPRYKCAPCYEVRQQIVSLQPTGKLGSRRHRIHMCPSCKSEFELGPEMKPDEETPAPEPPAKIDYSNKGII